MGWTDEQLLALLGDIESDRVERKQAFNKDTSDKVRQAICAFADNLSMTLEQDPYCLAMLKNYNSLMPLGLEARKPIFFLKSADGAIGSHSHAVQNAYDDFKALARKIAERINLSLPG